jgi:hypothetical protein
LYFLDRDSLDFWNIMLGYEMKIALELICFRIALICDCSYIEILYFWDRLAFETALQYEPRIPGDFGKGGVWNS